MDLGVVVVDGRLPEIGRFGDSPAAEQSVTAVGYPLGGPLTLSPGTVVDRVDGAVFGIEGTSSRAGRPRSCSRETPVAPCSMARGASSPSSTRSSVQPGFGLAIPVDTLRGLVRAGGLEDVPACGFRPAQVPGTEPGKMSTFDR